LARHRCAQHRRNSDRWELVLNTHLQIRSDSLRGRKVCILGAGITGLTAAFYLLRAGAEVTILEARPEVGGLSAHFDFGPFTWDRFYHCILTSDRNLLELLDDLGLTQELRWTKTKVGCFADGTLHSMSSSLDLLRFPGLNLWQKLRFGAGIVYASRIQDGRALEAEFAVDWLKKIFGRGNYEKMWGPLLKCKLGACREEASAAFIWATISRLYSTRKGSSDRSECLGYVRGGYRTIADRLLDEINRLGGSILTGYPVEAIHANDGLECNVAGRSERFDAVISTLPSPVLKKIAPQLPDEYAQQLGKVKYLGVICFALVLKQSLSPYYVTNLVDDVPFTGIVEMTNLISREEIAGRHLVYLPKYTTPGDPLFDIPEEQIWPQFRQSLNQVFPSLADGDIEKRFLFRERFVQPVPVLGYSALVPSIRTGVPGLIQANSTRIINSTLNNNEMVRIAHQAIQLIVDDSRQYLTGTRCCEPDVVPTVSKF
jgi:protoporphyrinogen oxidase